MATLCTCACMCIRIITVPNLSVLGDDTELAIGLEGIEHEDDVLVVQRPQDSYLLP